MESKRKEFDPNDDLINAFFKDKEMKKIQQEENLAELNTDLKNLGDSADAKSENTPESLKEEDDIQEDNKYYDNTYWKDPYSSRFKIENLLLE